MICIYHFSNCLVFLLFNYLNAFKFLDRSPCAPSCRIFRKVPHCGIRCRRLMTIISKVFAPRSFRSSWFSIGSQKKKKKKKKRRKKIVGRAGQLPCCFSSGQCRLSCLFGATGTLAVPGGWTSPPHCELRTILQTVIFRHRFFRVNGLCTLGPHSFSPHSVRQTFQ